MPSIKINSTTFQTRILKEIYFLNFAVLFGLSFSSAEAREMKLLPGLSVISVGSAVQDGALKFENTVCCIKLQ